MWLLSVSQKLSDTQTQFESILCSTITDSLVEELRRVFTEHPISAAAVCVLLLVLSVTVPLLVTRVL